MIKLLNICFLLPFLRRIFKGKNLFKGLVLGTGAGPVIADVDGDGDSDLVVGTSDGTLKYYQRNPSSSPTLFTELTGTDNPFNGFNVGTDPKPTFADISGDGKIDLVVGNNDGTLKYFLNESANGTITFTAKTAASDNPFSDIDVGTKSIPAFANISADSKIDLVVGNNDGTLNYFLNESANGAITFTAKTAVSDNPFSGIDVGTNSAPTFANISGDSKIDFVVGGSDGTLNYFLNESTSSTITFTVKTAPSDNPFNGFDVGINSVPTFGDIDGDTSVDLVVGENKGTLNSFLKKSTNFVQQTSTKNNFSGIDVGHYSTPTFADVDGDGKTDLLVGDSAGGLNYFLNESTTDTMTFTEQTSTDNPFDGFEAGDYSKPVFADVDRDGDLDLVVGQRTGGTLNYFLNESTTDTITFTKQTSTDSPLDGLSVGGYSAPAFADVDKDGYLDLVMGENDGTIQYFLNESQGWQNYLYSKDNHR